MASGRILRLFVRLMAALGVLCLLAGVVSLWWYMGEHAARQPDPAAYGARFGAAAALFAGLTFAGLLAVVLLQSARLTQVRKDLHIHRQQLQWHGRTAQQQHFESTFFYLMQLLRELAATRSGDEVMQLEGEAYWQYLAKQFKFVAKPIGDTANRKLLTAADIFQVNLPTLGPYLATLREILALISRAPPHCNKQRYARFLRAQLSHAQTAVLYHYGLSEQGQALKHAFEEYRLFAHMRPLDRLPEDTYNWSAFTDIELETGAAPHQRVGQAARPKPRERKRTA